MATENPQSPEHDEQIPTRNLLSEAWFPKMVTGIEEAKFIAPDGKYSILGNHPALANYRGNFWEQLIGFESLWGQPIFKNALTRVQGYLQNPQEIPEDLTILKQKVDEYQQTSSQFPVSTELLRYLTCRLGIRLNASLDRPDRKQITTPAITNEESYKKYLKYFYLSEHERVVLQFAKYDRDKLYRTFPAFKDHDAPTLSTAMSQLTQILESELSNQPYWAQYMTAVSSKNSTLVNSVALQCTENIRRGIISTPGGVYQSVSERDHSRTNFYKQLVYPSYDSYFTKRRSGDKIPDESTHNVAAIVQQAYEMVASMEYKQPDKTVGIYDVKNLAIETHFFDQPLFQAALHHARRIAEEHNPDWNKLLGSADDNFTSWVVPCGKQNKKLSDVVWSHLRAVANFRETRFREQNGVIGMLEALGRNTGNEKFVKQCITGTKAELENFPGIKNLDNQLTEALMYVSLLLNAALDMFDPEWSAYVCAGAHDMKTGVHTLKMQFPNFAQWKKNTMQTQKPNDGRYEGLDDLLQKLGVHTSWHPDSEPARTFDGWRWRAHPHGEGLSYDAIEGKQDPGRQPSGSVGTVYTSAR